MEATTIAAYTKMSVPTTAAENESQFVSAPITETTQLGESQPLAQEYTAPAQTTEIAQATPPPAPEVVAAAAPPSDQADRSLPKTASSYPLIALAGLLSLGLFATLRVIRARS
jgi:LPXTG-motif cell wall-anchored protein